MWLSWLAAMVLTIGVLQHLAAAGEMHWVYVLQRLYYVPTVLAGLVMGWRGGLGIAVLAGGAFAMGPPSIWTVSRADVVDEILEISMFCVVACYPACLRIDTENRKRFSAGPRINCGRHIKTSKKTLKE